MPNLVFRVADCTVKICEEDFLVITTLPDGKEVHASPNRRPEDLQTAILHGYSWHKDPEWAMCREHDFLHTLLAEALGLPFSPTLADVANELALEHVGKSAVGDHQWQEEARVMDLSLYINTGNQNLSLHNAALQKLSQDIDLEKFRNNALSKFYLFYLQNRSIVV